MLRSLASSTYKNYKIFIDFIVAVLLLYIYTLLTSSIYSNYTLVENSSIEYIILTIIYLVIAVILDKKHHLLISLVLVSFYISLDSISLIYNRTIDYTYISQIPLLWDAIIHSKGLVVYIIAFMFLIFVIFLLFRYSVVRKVVLSYAIVTLLIGIMIYETQYLSKIFARSYCNLAKYEKKFWSEKRFINYIQTGRISSFLYEGMVKNENLEIAKKFKVNQREELKVLVKKIKNHINLKNVYMIGLESFFLPSRLKNIVLNKTIEQSFITKDSSTHTASIFGGATIQSEFEILCGVPALQMFSAFELTEFMGTPTNCLPTILKELGYATIFTNTYKPQPSYASAKSMGFDDVNFAKEFVPNKDSYLTNKNISNGEYAIFDSDMFLQNSIYIQKNYIDKNIPIFNYMFSVYGHAFHEMTSKDRPQIIDVKNSDELKISKHSIRAINQNYYRIKALEKYINGLSTNNPDALIILYSDHLPVLEGANSYSRYGMSKDKLFSNYLFVKNASDIIRYKDVNLYSLKDIILNLLSDGWYCKNNACIIDFKNDDRFSRENDYYKIMAPAMQQPDIGNLAPLKIGSRYKFDSDMLVFKGFSTPENNFRWSDEKESEIAFKLSSYADIEMLSLDINMATLGMQSIEIMLNNKLIFSDKISTTNKTISLKINSSILKANNILNIKLRDAKMPGNGDARILAMQFRYLEIKKGLDDIMHNKDKD